jgi:putative transposase
MGRLPRYVLPGEPQHIIQRGHNNNPIYFGKKDYSVYLKYLKKASGKYGCHIHAYVLMTNHIHLLVTPFELPSISKMMQSLNSQYVKYVNTEYERSGTLWGGRYRASLIQCDLYLLTCYRYIELNPVRAGMVSSPADYPWSSYMCHAHGHLNPLITDHALYTTLGNNMDERMHAYQGLINIELNSETVNSIRKATNSAWILGNHSFKLKIEMAVKRKIGPLPRGGKRSKGV